MHNLNSEMQRVSLHTNMINFHLQEMQNLIGSRQTPREPKSVETNTGLKEEALQEDIPLASQIDSVTVQEAEQAHGNTEAHEAEPIPELAPSPEFQEKDASTDDANDENNVAPQEGYGDTAVSHLFPMHNNES